MRKYASAEERVAKNQKTTVRHFGFTEKVYGLPCTVRTMLLWKRYHRNGPLLHVPITKYKIIPNPNPNPNTNMTVNTIPKQM